jgi:predicted transposase YdaD
MGNKDILSKRILKQLVRDFATYLFRLPVVEVNLLDTQIQRIEERRTDLLAQVQLPGGESFLLHIEIQNNNQAHMPGRMLRYLSDIVLEYPNQPVRQYLLYIGKEKLTMADGLDMPDFCYRYRVVDMHQIDCDDFLQQDSPDAWLLAILCDFKDRLPRDIIHTILTRLTQHFGENPPRLREYVDMLDILASNRDFNIDIFEELKMLTIDVEKLATYRLGMEKGIEQGMEKGMKKGIEKGIEKGLETGIKTGMEQGAKKGAYEQALIIANKMLQAGFSVDQTASMTDLPTEEIDLLRNNPPKLNG